MTLQTEAVNLDTDSADDIYSAADGFDADMPGDFDPYGTSDDTPGAGGDAASAVDSGPLTVLLRDVLRYRDDEYASILHGRVGGANSSVVDTATRIAAVEAKGEIRTLSNERGEEVWFGVNPTAGPPRKGGGRGGNEDVTRIAALIADIDVKPGACETLEMAHAVVAELGIILGTKPVAIIHSGGGLQPIWPIAGSDDDLSAVRALLARWGRAVQAVAKQRGIRLDNVSDAARVLRVPGSYNHKYGEPRPVSVEYPRPARPITTAKVISRLDEWGIEERPDDGDINTEPIKPSDEWEFGETTCDYVAKMIAGFVTDAPKTGTGRNPWLYGQTIRLLAAHRLGCITETDFLAAAEALKVRFAEIIDDPQYGQPRAVKRLEHADCHSFGAAKVSKKTDPETIAELGDHTHPPTADNFWGDPTRKANSSSDSGDRSSEDRADPGGQPIPLTVQVVIPPFPVDALPQAYADMVDAVAEATQTDPAMPGVSALSVLSACVGGWAEIEIRQGWREPLHIYTATVAGPGERKSAVQSAFTAPLLDVEAAMAEDIKLLRAEKIAEKTIAEKALEKLINQAATGKTPAERDAAHKQIRAAAETAESIEVPPIPQLVADDITPEAANTLMSEQGGRIAVISAEGGLFDIIAGRYSGKAENMDVWLKGHSGDSVKVNRKGRPPEYIRKPAVTLGLMIQPSVLSGLADNKQFRGRGLIARILFAFPASKVGRRVIGAKPVSEQIDQRYKFTVADLAVGMVDQAGDLPAVLSLTPKAHDAVLALEGAVESQLAGEGELALLPDWGSKYVGAVMRIAGMLHLGEFGVDGLTKPVSASTILAAGRVGNYFKACAVRAFADMGTDQGTADAVYLLERISSLGMAEISERDLHAATRSRFPKKNDLAPAITRLVDYGWLIPLSPPTPTGGRPASPRYTVVPPPGAGRPACGDR